MKLWLRSILCLGLAALILPFGALADGASGGNPGGSAFVEGVAIERLATRSGPSSEHKETGTFWVETEPVRILSRAYDGSGLCWVQCEVPYENKLRRVYTGLKRFDATTFDLASVPEEDPLERKAKATDTSKALYGPGEGYGAYDELEVEKGQVVTIIAVEDGYAQVEWETSVQRYRAWVPERTLLY